LFFLPYFILVNYTLIDPACQKNTLKFGHKFGHTHELKE